MFSAHIKGLSKFEHIHSEEAQSCIQHEKIHRVQEIIMEKKTNWENHELYS